MTKITTNVVYKSVLTDIKSIPERNEAFNALYDVTKRKEIAWDALQMVLLGFVKASHGCYWSNSLSTVEGDSKELQELFNQPLFFEEHNCRVCQRGLMMLSQIRLGNSIGSDDCAKSKGDWDNIKGFSYSSFLNMESEYERNYFGHPHHNNTNEKLANICCNVLANGDFEIWDRTDYLTVLVPYEINN